MIDKETQRAAFEAWFCKQYWNFKETDPGLWTGSSYRHLSVELAWNSWQAAQAQLAERLRAAEVGAVRWKKVKQFSRPMSLNIDGMHFWQIQLRDIRGATIDEAVDAAIAKEKTP